MQSNDRIGHAIVHSNTATLDPSTHPRSSLPSLAAMSQGPVSQSFPGAHSPVKYHPDPNAHMSYSPAPGMNYMAPQQAHHSQNGSHTGQSPYRNFNNSNAPQGGPTNGFEKPQIYTVSDTKHGQSELMLTPLGRLFRSKSLRKGSQWRCVYAPESRWLVERNADPQGRWY